MQFLRLTAFFASALVVASASPVIKVVQLLRELEASIETDGKVEQQSYDKNACWCEETLARKAGDISDAKTEIEALTATIEKLSGEVAVHGAEVKQLEKDIAANQKAQQEATDVRKKGNGEYVAEKTESEQAIGALEAAVNVLTGAGDGKKNDFLATSMQEANLISVAASIRPVLGQTLTSRVVSGKDFQIVRRFVEEPASFARLKRNGFSGSHSVGALQVEQNPFGDYAPQSTQIQGILKGLYDAFAQSLEKANVEEAEAQKAFQELMATKQAELKTLQATLEKQNLGFAEKTEQLAQSKKLREDTEAQLVADEAFFEDSKAACKSKALEWSTRSGLRTEELQGVKKAIQILSSLEAQATFHNASTTLLQIHRASTVARDSRQADGVAAARRLRALAAKHPNNAANFLTLAAAAESSGHFDVVIGSIDKMMEVLRKEEQDDIEHRDRCQGAQNKNKNDMEDLDHAIATAKSAISRMNDEAQDLKDAIRKLEGEINATNEDLDVALKMRNKEVKEFRQALKDDTEAIALLNQALLALAEFYKRNQIEMGFIQKKSAPVYSIDANAMPAVEWTDANYEGRQDTSAPVISMISAIKEDLEQEIKTSRADEVATQKSYEKQRDAMRASLKAATESKVATEKELANVQVKIQDTEKHQASKEADLGNQDQMKATLIADCAWVESHFESRRVARKNEMDGLIDAKGFLAGMEKGGGI